MDQDLYAAAIDYELLTKQIHGEILKIEGQREIDVLHDKSMVARSGVEHQVDVHWKFKQAGIGHTVLIECKNYKTPVTLEKVRSFFSVLHDIGNCRGLMVTKTGFQSGVEKFAQFYGIALKLLRKPTPDDWKGRIKDIRAIMTVKLPVSIVVTAQAEPIDLNQARQLLTFLGKGISIASAGPETIFVNKEGNPITDEMRWWLPRKLNFWDKDDGGPYEEIILLDDHYVDSGIPDLDHPIVKVKSLSVKYRVESQDIREIKIHGEEIVKAVLIDNASGTHEYVTHQL
jgi:hypothetical protein